MLTSEKTIPCDTEAPHHNITNASSPRKKQISAQAFCLSHQLRGRSHVASAEKYTVQFVWEHKRRRQKGSLAAAEQPRMTVSGKANDNADNERERGRDCKQGKERRDGKANHRRRITKSVQNH